MLFAAAAQQGLGLIEHPNIGIVILTVLIVLVLVFIIATQGFLPELIADMFKRKPKAEVKK